MTGRIVSIVWYIQETISGMSEGDVYEHTTNSKFQVDNYFDLSVGYSLTNIIQM